MRHITLCLGEVFSKYLLGSFWLMVSINSCISLFSLCLYDLSIGKNGVIRVTQDLCMRVNV